MSDTAPVNNGVRWPGFNFDNNQEEPEWKKKPPVQTSAPQQTQSTANVPVAITSQGIQVLEGTYKGKYLPNSYSKYVEGLQVNADPRTGRHLRTGGKGTLPLHIVEEALNVQPKASATPGFKLGDKSSDDDTADTSRLNSSLANDVQQQGINRGGAQARGLINDVADATKGSAIDRQSDTNDTTQAALEQKAEDLKKQQRTENADVSGIGNAAADNMFNSHGDIARTGGAWDWLNGLSYPKTLKMSRLVDRLNNTRYWRGGHVGGRFLGKAEAGEGYYMNPVETEETRSMQQRRAIEQQRTASEQALQSRQQAYSYENLVDDIKRDKEFVKQLNNQTFEKSGEAVNLLRNITNYVNQIAIRDISAMTQEQAEYTMQNYMYDALLNALRNDTYSSIEAAVIERGVFGDFFAGRDEIREDYLRRIIEEETAKQNININSPEGKLAVDDMTDKLLLGSEGIRQAATKMMLNMNWTHIPQNLGTMGVDYRALATGRTKPYAKLSK